MGIRLAHIAKDGRQQSVYDHLKNAMEFCGLYAGKIGLSACGKLAGMLHDIGKFSDGFQEYITCANQDRGYRKIGPDHSTAGAVYILNFINKSSSKQKRITAQIISMVIMWHHGGLKDICDNFGESQYLKRIKKLGDSQWKTVYESVVDEFHRSFSREYVENLFEQASQEVDAVLDKLKTMVNLKNDDEDIRESEQHFCLGLLCKFLYSCLIDADRYDTMTFCDNMQMSRPVDNSRLWQELSDTFEAKYSSLKRDSEINRLRSKLSDNCFNSSINAPGIYMLNCPTGSGKTLSSLRYSLNHAVHFHKDRIFYIIPFISIIEQNSKVIKDFLRGNATSRRSDDIDKIVFELHSAVDVEPDEEADKDINDLKEMELLTERLDAPMIITTMVRFLNTFFKSGTRNPRPIHNFANSIIIFDEIQAIPIRCIGMFNSLVNFLVSVCNATVILSTATQIVLDHSHGKEPALAIQSKEEISGCLDDIREKFKRVEFITDLLPGPAESPSTLEDIAKEMRKSSMHSTSILAILNTKNAASALYDCIAAMREKGLLDDEFSIYYLSTRLCPAHRARKLSEIKRKIDNKEKVIVISTQLIEAGVDVSFQVVFRSLAGLDSIIQAAGRCNREGLYEKGKVILFELASDIESLKHLKSIEKGNLSTKLLLRSYKKNPDKFRGRYDSAEAIDFYFKKYLNAEADELKYPFEISGSSNVIYMYDILAGNIKFTMDTRNAIAEVFDRGWAPELRQSFAMAGHNFEAIETIGIPVIVPYGEGAEITEQLSSASSLEEKSKLMKKAQRYCININIYNKSEINNYADFYDDTGLYILKEQHYDDVKGFIEEAKLKILVF